MAEPVLGVMLVDGGHARLLAGFTLAAGGLAMGRRVRIFVTGPALAGVCTDYVPPEDEALAARGLAGVVALRDACLAMEAELLACDSAMVAAGLAEDRLCAGVRVAGIPSLLEGGVTPAVF